MKRYYLYPLLLALLACLGFYLYFGWLNSNQWKLISFSNENFHYPPIYSKIAFFDKNRGFAVGNVFRETIDGGKTWQKVLRDEKESTNSLVFTSQTDGWAVGGEINGTDEEWVKQTIPKWKRFKLLILKTEDAGANWQKIELDKEAMPKEGNKFDSINDICFDKSGKSWIVGYGGIIEAKIENKMLKVLNKFPMDNLLYSVSCGDSGDVWAVGSDGIIVHYQNGSWSKINAGADMIKDDTSYFRVKTIGDEVWIIGSSSPKQSEQEGKSQTQGILLKSRDNGQTWENKSPAKAGSLSDIWFNGKEGWLVGEKGSIYHTSDGGNSWGKQNSPTENDLWGIFFLNSNKGWISGNKATVLKYEK